PEPDVPAPRRPVLRLRRPSPQAVRAAVTDTAVVTGRNLRHFIRQPDLLVFSTIQPVLFVLLFVYVFGGAIGRSLPHGVAYVDFLLPGVFVQSVTFGASQTAVGLKEDLTRGVVDRFRSMPMARSAVLAGRTVADLGRTILIIGLMIAVGYLVGFRFLGGVAGAVACIAVVAAFGLALSWIFAFVALTVRGAETAQTAGFVVIFPLVFASSVFVPVSTFPDWLQAFAKINPVPVTANAARSLALYGTPASLGAAAAWIGGLLAVFIPLSVWRYRRVRQAAFRHLKILITYPWRVPLQTRAAPPVAPVARPRRSPGRWMLQDYPRPPGCGCLPVTSTPCPAGHGCPLAGVGGAGRLGGVIARSWASRRLCHYAYRRDLRRHRACRGAVPVACRPGVDSRGLRGRDAAAVARQRHQQQQLDVPAGQRAERARCDAGRPARHGQPVRDPGCGRAVRRAADACRRD